MNVDRNSSTQTLFDLPTMRITKTILLATSIVILTAQSAAGLDLLQVGDGFHRPVHATSPPGETDRMFVVEQFTDGSLSTGTIQILDLNTGLTNPGPFLTLDEIETSGSSPDFQGVQSMVFHPDYATNGKFYVNLIGAGAASYVREYEALGTPSTSTLADPFSGRTIFSYAKPASSSHNSGWMGFGPDDGYLYITSGDGGGGGDPHNNGQNINDLNGAVLRIDVDNDAFPGDPDQNYTAPATNPFVGTSGADEIWAYGLRNPWKASFDRQTGDLYIADVGEGAREELNVQPASHIAAGGGLNYGWKIREGTTGPALPGATDPVYNYTHGGGPNQGFSITGGYVYRGSMPEIQGDYFFADFTNARVWSLRYDGSDPSTHNGTNFTDFVDRTSDLASSGAVSQIVSFAEDGAGELYLLSLDGSVHKIVRKAEPPDPVPTTGRYAHAILNSGPVAYYRLEHTTGAAVDTAIANGSPQQGAQHGIYDFTSPSGARGVIGPRSTDTIGGLPLAGLPAENRAANFGGVTYGPGDRITTADPAIDVPETGDFAIEMLFKPNLDLAGSGQIPFQELASKGDCCAGTNSWYLLYWGPDQGIQPPGTLRFGVNAQGPPNSVDSTATIPGDEYTHIVASYEAATQTGSLFINGEFSNSAAFANSLPLSPGDPLVIGGLTGDQTNFARGIIDEVAYYARGLTAAEIADHFRSLTSTLVGDYDNDGEVDDEDFLIWKQEFGLTVDPVGIGADGNGDGIVNALDFAVWRNNLGATADPPGGATVPEPGSILLLVVGLLLLQTHRKIN